MSLKKTLVVVLTLALLAFLSGCATLTQKAAEKAVEQTTGAKVNTKEKKVTVETEEGKTEVQVETKKLPEDFPEDFPICEGAKEFNFLRQEGSEGVHLTVNYLVDKGLSEVDDFYKDSLPKNGYKIQQSISTSEFTSYTFKKDKIEGVVSMNVEEDTKQTSVMITMSVGK